MVTLRDGDLMLRPFRRRDWAEWDALRRANHRWLERWEATPPNPTDRLTYPQYVREQARAARAGTGYSFLMDVDGELIGNLSISSVIRGSLAGCSIGYWISEHRAGRGYTPRAVALACDFAFGALGLHRVEINIRPENGPSLRVVEKLRFRDEGVRLRFLHIAGQWCDHRTFALTSEEVSGSMLERLQGS